jgi:hypothetical protein
MNLHALSSDILDDGGVLATSSLPAGAPAPAPSRASAPEAAVLDISIDNITSLIFYYADKLPVKAGIQRFIQHFNVSTFQLWNSRQFITLRRARRAG